MEPLEQRMLLHNPVITGVTADNRGEVLVRFDPGASEIDPAGFNKQSVRMLSPGPDRILGTSDDQRIPASVRYRADIQRLLVRAVSLEPGSGYLVRINSELVPVAPGFAIDGEFTGRFPSGDGQPGGDFQFQVKKDRSETPRARISTSEGPILLTMRADWAPANVGYVLKDADAGNYDNTCFTRSEPGVLIQAGSLQIRDNQVIERPGWVFASEYRKLPNIRGTVTKTVSPVVDPVTQLGHLPSNAFFFNLADNPQFDANDYNVFAEVATPEGLAVMDAIAAKPRVDLTGLMGPFAETLITDVPVQDDADVTTSVDPSNDLILIRRFARAMRVAPL